MKKTQNSACFQALASGCITAALFFGLTASSEAQTPVDWDGSDSTAWSLGDNWSGGNAPVDDITTNIARFGTIGFTNQPNAGTRSIAGLSLSGATAVTISGTSLTIGASGITTGITNASGLTLSTGIVLGANQTWGVSGSARNITISGQITSLADRILNVAGRTDSATLGQFTFSNTGNSYTGTTNFTAGLTQGSGSVNAFGTSALNVSSGAGLFLNNSGSWANAITLNGGNGLSVTGATAGYGVALRLANNGTVSGAVTLAAGNSSVGANNSFGTISGQITGGGALTVGTTQSSGGTTAGAAFIISNTGNDWTGGLTIRGHETDTTKFQVLRLGTSGVITNTNSVTFGVSGDTVGVNARLDLNGFNETVDLLSSHFNGSGVIFNGDDVTTSTLTIGGGSASSATFSGIIQNDNPVSPGTDNVVALSTADFY